MKKSKLFLVFALIITCALSLAGCGNVKSMLTDIDTNLIEISSNENFKSANINGISSQFHLKYTDTLNSAIESSSEYYYTEITSIYNAILAESIEYANRTRDFLIAEVNNGKSVNSSRIKNLSENVKNLKNSVASLQQKIETFNYVISSLNGNSNAQIEIDATYNFKKSLSDIISNSVKTINSCSSIIENDFGKNLKALELDRGIISSYLLSFNVNVFYKTVLNGTELKENFELLSKRYNCEFLNSFHALKNHFISVYKKFKTNEVNLKKLQDTQEIFKTMDNFVKTYTDFNVLNLKSEDYDLEKYINSSTQKRLDYNTITNFINIIYSDYLKSI